MSEVNAESAYLFRHALLRDAAYQLQLPSDRAKLHALAFELLDRLFQRESDDAKEAIAAELADHARLGSSASGANTAELAKGEARYLWLAARHFDRMFLVERAVETYERLAAHGAVPADKRAEALQLAGAVYAAAGRHVLAQPLFEHAILEAQKAKAPVVIHRATMGLALLLQQLGKTAESESKFVLARSAALESGDKALEATTLNNQAILLHHLGKNLKADTLACRAQTLATELGIHHLEASAYVTRGVIAKQTGRLDEAAGHYARALEVAQSHALIRQEAMTRYNLAGLLVDSGKASEAAQMFKDVIRLAVELGARRMEGLALGNLAVVFTRTGDFAAAEPLYFQSTAIARELGNRPGEAASMGNLACLYNSLGRFKDAEPLFLEALRIHREVGNRRFLGAHGCPFACCLLGLGRTEEAAREWMSALQIIESLPDPVLRKTQVDEMRQLCEAWRLKPLPADART
jgi:tetratricopeptide (TPR) repeat protein